MPVLYFFFFELTITSFTKLIKNTRCTVVSSFSLVTPYESAEVCQQTWPVSLVINTLNVFVLVWESYIIVNPLILFAFLYAFSSPVTIMAQKFWGRDLKTDIFIYISIEYFFYRKSLRWWSLLYKFFTLLKFYS